MFASYVFFFIIFSIQISKFLFYLLSDLFEVSKVNLELSFT